MYVYDEHVSSSPGAFAKALQSPGPLWRENRSSMCLAVAATGSCLCALNEVRGQMSVSLVLYAPALACVSQTRG